MRPTLCHTSALRDSPLWYDAGVMHWNPAHCIVTCEHASNRVPSAYGTLGLARRRLQEHIAWDPGAAIMARLLAWRIGCPLHLGRWSRLLVDLNRTAGHPKWMAPSSFGVVVPANLDLPADEVERRRRL